jgi:hypothetical protein
VAYRELHERRSHTFLAEIDGLKGRQEWPEIPEDMQKPLLAPLETRTCAGLVRPVGAVVCETCRATMPQIESDIAAAHGFRSQVIVRMQELTRPKERVERVRLSDLLQEPLDDEAAVERFVEALKAQLLKLLAEGNRIVIE